MAKPGAAIPAESARMTVLDRRSSRVRREIVFVFALVLASYVVWLVREELLLLYVSGLFAVVFAPVVRSVAKVRVGRWQPFRRVAVLMLPLGAVVFLGLFCALALPPVLRDLVEFSREIPSRAPALLEKLRHLPFTDRINSNDVIERLQNLASNAVTDVLLSLRNWANALLSVLMGFVLTMYFIVEGDQAYSWFLSFFPATERDRLDRTLRRAEGRMGKWLLGQGSLMLILGLCSTIVYLALGVRYAYALGALTGLLNIIPVLGAAVCIVLALLVAAMDSWGRVLGVAIFYFLWLQLENSILVPRIMRSSVGLPALAILVALLLGSALGGIVGATVAVPTGVLVAELVNEYLVHKSPA
jgi:predicted PurR-regulated permease PerM